MNLYNAILLAYSPCAQRLPSASSGQAVVSRIFNFHRDNFHALQLESFLSFQSLFLTLPVRLLPSSVILSPLFLEQNRNFLTL
jgi:hypothetical protein